MCFEGFYVLYAYTHTALLHLFQREFKNATNELFKHNGYDYKGPQANIESKPIH